MNETQILEALPYTEPFLFVDGITTVNESHNILKDIIFLKKNHFFTKDILKIFQ